MRSDKLAHSCKSTCFSCFMSRKMVKHIVREMNRNRRKNCKMLVKTLFFILLILQLATLHEACKSGVWKRRKRATVNTHQHEVLRDYFSKCISTLLQVNQSSNYNWTSNVEFTLISSEWYAKTNKAICATEDGHNTKECWQQELEEYLNNDTSLLEVVKTCIVHYFDDYRNDPNSPRYNRTKRSTQTWTISDQADPNLISADYSNCIGQISSDKSIDYQKLLASIERHTVLRKCNKDLLTRPPPFYRKFLALTRLDNNLSDAIEICNEDHFPSDPCHSRKLSEGMIADPEKGKYNLGEVVTFKCISPHHELVGSPTSTCEGADGWSSQVPTCKGQCLSPLIPANMRAKPSKAKYDSGDVVNFTCISENLLLTGSTSSSCQDSGSWSSRIPSCQAITCSPAHSNPTNGLVICSKSNSLGSVCTFRCNFNFRLIGWSRSVCEDDEDGDDDGVWSRRAPVCRGSSREPTRPTTKPMKLCHPITNFENGSMTIRVDYRMSITFKCNGGFNLVGHSVMKCVNGTWSTPVPTCQRGPPTCSMIAPPKNGIFSPVHIGDPNEKFQLAIKVSCNEGYTLDPTMDEVVFCNKTTGQWSGGIASCIKKSPCPAIPLVENGSVRIENVTVMDQTVKVATFNCNSDFELVGDRSLSCSDLGYWSKQIPTCKETRSCEIPTVENGGHQMLTSQSPNLRVMFWCKIGYTMLGSPYNRCDRGRWTLTVPTCEMNPNCPLPAPPANMNVAPISSFYQHGSRVMYSCKKSSDELLGTRTMICFRGEWQGNKPICRTRVCPVPTPPENGSVMMRGDLAEQTPNSRIVFRCNNNLTLFGSNTSTCRSYGYWSPSTPTCAVNRTCPLLETVVNGKISKLSGTAYPHVYSRVRVRCDPYYESRGSTYLTCRPGGVWSTSMPTCRERATCPNLSIPNSMVDAGTFPKPYLYTHVTVTCAEGYQLDGSTKIYCRGSRKSPQWSPLVPMCRPTHGGCKAITSIPHGRVTNNAAFGVTFLVFDCDSDYVMKGQAVMHCTSKGYWDPPLPPLCQDATAPSKEDM